MIRRLLCLIGLSLFGLLLTLSVAETLPRHWPLPERGARTSSGSLWSVLAQGWDLENLRMMIVALALSALPLALSCWLLSQWGPQGKPARSTPSLLTPLASLGGALLTVAGLALSLPLEEPNLLLLLLFSPSLTLLFSLRGLILLMTSRSYRREAQREQERGQP